MAARRREIRLDFFHCRRVAIEEGRVNLALVRMQQRYTEEGYERRECTFAGRAVGQAYQLFGLEESGWSCAEGTDAIREGGAVATEATETASSPKKLILICVSTSTGLPST